MINVENFFIFIFCNNWNIFCYDDAKNAECESTKYTKERLLFPGLNDSMQKRKVEAEENIFTVENDQKKSYHNCSIT